MPICFIYLANKIIYIFFKIVSVITVSCNRCDLLLFLSDRKVYIKCISKRTIMVLTALRMNETYLYFYINKKLFE